MLTSLTQLLNKEIHIFQSAEDQRRLKLFENIDRHISALHFRNAQLRNAILASSDEKIDKRNQQFLTVLHSYIHLLVTELHGKICLANNMSTNSKYVDIKNETFSGYEELLKECNRTSDEILIMGEEYTRELFKFEIQLKKYQALEEKFVYPLYQETSQIDPANTNA